MTQEGHNAPDFLLPSSSGALVSLKNLKGSKVVLYFYPKDSTPGCTMEAREFQVLLQDFVNCNTLIFGISKDSIKSHNKFTEKECLSFALLSDESAEVCQSYGVWQEKSMFGKKYMGISRTTFLIDEDGIIKKVWHNVSVAGHAAEVLKYIRC